MNRSIRLFASALVISSLLVYSQCGDDDSGESLETLFGTNLTGTFVLESANPPTGTFSEFSGDPNTITFNGLSNGSGSFSSQNTIATGFDFPLFPTTSTWQVQSASSESAGTVLINNSPVTVTITGTSVNLSFTLDASGGLTTNRQSSVQGQWQVTATPQP
ncbi:MAG: hypothetical protein AAF363_10565 [Bacteroidota bacterium]